MVVSLPKLSNVRILKIFSSPRKIEHRYAKMSCAARTTQDYTKLTIDEGREHGVVLHPSMAAFLQSSIYFNAAQRDYRTTLTYHKHKSSYIGIGMLHHFVLINQALEFPQ
ncbi:hypothetical protein SLA2020_181340 [Shorea laevis]